MKNAIAIVLTTLVLALRVAPAAAMDFTFTAHGAPSGVWGDEITWASVSGPGIPKAGDMATIPGGKTCRVELANQAAASIHLVGIMTIAGRSLTLTADSMIDLGGPLPFETVGANVPELVIAADLSIGGLDANLMAEAPNKGIIAATGNHTLTLNGVQNSGPLLMGSFDIGVNLVMNGGQAEMQGGEMHIGVVTFLPPGVQNMDWNAFNGGFIEITAACTGCSNFREGPRQGVRPAHERGYSPLSRRVISPSMADLGDWRSKRTL